jgi:hypothetical protein
MQDHRPVSLHTLLRGEQAAAATYQQALAMEGDAAPAGDLRRIHDGHRLAASTLRQHVQQEGDTHGHGSGVWAAFAHAAPRTGKGFGNAAAALDALKAGEEQGVRDYERALGDAAVSDYYKAMIRSTLLPLARSHLPVLDRLLASKSVTGHRHDGP